MELTKAIAQIMESGDASLLTGSGKPKTEAIEAIIGAKITAAQRDAAFAEYTASSRDSIAGSSEEAEATTVIPAQAGIHTDDAATTDAAAEATTVIPAQAGIHTDEAPAIEPALIISTVKGVKSFRRAGLAFTSAPTTVLLRDLTAAQVEALKGEKMLTVQETTGN